MKHPTKKPFPLIDSDFEHTKTRVLRMVRACDLKDARCQMLDTLAEHVVHNVHAFDMLREAWDVFQEVRCNPHITEVMFGQLLPTAPHVAPEVAVARGIVSRRRTGGRVLAYGATTAK